MTATEDAKNQLSKVKREPGETDYQLARRCYELVQGIYNKHAGGGLSEPDDFDDLKPADKETWFRRARTK